MTCWYVKHILCLPLEVTLFLQLKLQKCQLHKLCLFTAEFPGRTAQQNFGDLID